MPSPFTFKKYGQCGMEVSELFPNIATHVDEIAFLRSVYGRSNDHTLAHYEMQSGQIRSGYPAMGSWLTYGLGSENSGLPGFVVLHDYRGGPIGGPAVWSAGFLPAAYQGTPFRASGDPIVDLKPPAGVTPDQQRARLDTLAKLNELHMEQHPGSSELAARISSYELAFRMQTCAPTVVDINNESEATKKLYGLDQEITEPFGRQCLLARRLVESGVRFVQLFHGGMGNQSYDTWDARRRQDRNAHQALPPSPTYQSRGCCPTWMARGLLEATLVIWTTEFGRMPIHRAAWAAITSRARCRFMDGRRRYEGRQGLGATDEFEDSRPSSSRSPITISTPRCSICSASITKKLRYRHNGID